MKPPSQILFEYVINLNRILETERNQKTKAIIKKVRKNIQNQRRLLITTSLTVFPNIHTLQAEKILEGLK